ncbi:MAG: hypothetical protein A2026_15435 [Deltaproteobacteria bacterium RBG_19FT_COMBO_46_12]|jgi:hypothetical protein|nr:MAG: hypothetical protein A2026_15435 [Deltaproteobacteria bacterium RBG_19FT_COMBO_46_12]
MEESWKSVPEFPLFKNLSLEDKPILDLAFKQFPPLISEFTFTNLFIWRHAYQIKISRLQNFLFLFAENGEHPFFFPPIGEGDVVECCRALLRSMKEKGVSVKIARVPEDLVSRFDWKAEGFMVEFDRDQSDYIYLTEDLITLQGRKYHRKRNHIKKFKERYAYRYIPLTTEQISECLQLETKWCDLRQCEIIPGLFNESVATKEAFSHFEALEVKGGAILIEDKVEAFTLGEPLNQETVVIHIEKANPDFDGLYPMINQAFLENHWSGYAYVNREQDLGEEGLRKAKESYFPHQMINKYTLCLTECNE